MALATTGCCIHSDPGHTQSLENIGHLDQLEELWVGKNKIAKLEVRLDVCDSS